MIVIPDLPADDPRYIAAYSAAAEEGQDLSEVTPPIYPEAEPVDESPEPAPEPEPEPAPAPAPGTTSDAAPEPAPGQTSEDLLAHISELIASHLRK